MESALSEGVNAIVACCHAPIRLNRLIGPGNVLFFVEAPRPEMNIAADHGRLELVGSGDDADSPRGAGIDITDGNGVFEDEGKVGIHGHVADSIFLQMRWNPGRAAPG